MGSVLPIALPVTILGAFIFTLELGGGWEIQRDFVEGKFSLGRGNPDLTVDCVRQGKAREAFQAVARGDLDLFDLFTPSAITSA